MSDAIQVTTDGLSTTCSLPWRELGLRRYTLVLRAALLAGISLVVVYHFPHWVWWIKGALSALSLWSILPLVLPSRAEIILEPGLLRWRERGWLKRFGASAPRNQIRRLRVDAAKNYQGQRKRWYGWASLGESHLIAELSDGSEVPIVLGYPRATVIQIADLLRDHLFPDPLPDTDSVIDLAAVPLIMRDLNHPPPNCQILLHQADDIVTFTYHRYSKTGYTLRIATISAFVLAISSGLTISLAREIDRGNAISDLLGIFALNAILLFVALNFLRATWRTLLIVATPDGLALIRHGFFAPVEQSFLRPEILAIHTAEAPPASFQFNNRTEQAMLLLATPKSRLCLYIGDAPTWRWIATHLRHTLNLPTLTPPNPAAPPPIPI